jgi:hypothetical protein
MNNEESTTYSFFNELLRAREHPLEDTTRPLLVSVSHIHGTLPNPTKRFASPLLAALLEGMD